MNFNQTPQAAAARGFIHYFLLNFSVELVLCDLSQPAQTYWNNQRIQVLQVLVIVGVVSVDTSEEVSLVVLVSRIRHTSKK